MRSTVFAIIVSALLCSAVLLIDRGYFSPQVACAQDDWKKEFDDICAKTDDSMSLSDGELKALVERAEKLKPIIEKLDESEKKIYGRRLQKCRDLLGFVLSSRKKD